MHRKLYWMVVVLGMALGMLNISGKNLAEWQGQSTPTGGGRVEYAPPIGAAAQGSWTLSAGAQKSTLRIVGSEPTNGVFNRLYTITFAASIDINVETTVTFSLLGKTPAQDEPRPLQPAQAQSVNALPGVQQKLTLTFAQSTAAEAGEIVPVLSVNNIQAGKVVVDGFTVTELEAPATAVFTSRLPGYRAGQAELPRFFWHGPVSYDKFAKMLDYAALGLHIITVKPEHQRAGFQWPDGSAVVAEHTAKGWEIQAFTGADVPPQRQLLASESIEMACYGSGVIVREVGSAQGINFPGGLCAGGIVLLSAAEAPTPEVRNLEIYPLALNYCFLDEANKTLQQARQQYEDNAAVLQRHKVGERPWKEKFSFYQKTLDEALQLTLTGTEGFLPIIVADPVLRDRYNHLVWMSNNELSSEGGYFGGEFRRLWFSHLGGHPLVQSIQSFERKVRALVSRSRRLTGATFQEGAAYQERLSAGWCDSLTQVPRRAGLPGPLDRVGNIQIAREERESVQLVLSTGRQGVGRCSVEIGPGQFPGLSVKSYRVEYVWLTESSNPQLPLREPGESEFPDVLEPLAAGEEFALGAYQNQAIWLTFHAATEAQPGNYDFTVQIKIDGEVAMTVPCRVQVAKFALGPNRLENMIGMRFSTMQKFYGEAGYEKARRNLMQELLDHQMNPLDLYALTPPIEDVSWALTQGLTSVNLGGSLSGLAHPAPGMLKFIHLYGSLDGLEYVEIPADFTLQARDPNTVSDHDLLVVPRVSTAEYRYLKVHNAETRGWYDRCPYAFFVLYPGLGQAVEAVGTDGAVISTERIYCLQPDLTPEKGGVLSSDNQPGTFAFDNLRDDANRSSIMIDLQKPQSVGRLRLINRHIEIVSQSLTASLEKMQKLTEGKVPIYLYGFDEVASHLNGQLKSALENAKKLLPGVRLVTTASNPQAMPEVFANIDVHCPANAYALPRHDQAVQKRYGVDFWTYVGGGGYYPFGSFERVDQPLINSRAFFWESIAFSHITGFLYWDIHMWRNNNQFAENLPPVWSEWDTTHGENNGMGALFYPGPNGISWPSMRAETMRDGIEDYNYTRVAEELLANRQFADAASRQRSVEELVQIKSGFARGMSVFCQDSRECSRLRRQLIELIERLLDMPAQ